MTDTLQDPFTIKGVPVPEASTPPRPHRALRMIVRTCVIVLVMVVLAELYVRAIGPYFPIKLDGLGEMVRKREQLDGPIGSSAQVVFAGDSMMDVGGDPVAFAGASTHYTSAYNASLLGAPVAGTTSWLKQVVLPANTPKVVVLGVAPSAVLAPDVDFSGVARNQVEEQISQTGSDAWLTLTKDASDNSAIVRHRQYLRSPQAVWDATSDAISGSDPPSNPAFERMRVDGYWERTVNDHGQVVHLSSDKLGRQFNPELVHQLIGFDPDYANLDRALDTLADEGVAVVVAIPPIAVPVWEASHVDVGRWRDIAAAIATHAQQHGVPVYDYTDAGFPREMFNDYVHLNEDGARRFSTDLASKLDVLCTQQTIPCG